MGFGLRNLGGPSERVCGSDFTLGPRSLQVFDWKLGGLGCRIWQADLKPRRDWADVRVVGA